MEVILNYFNSYRLSAYLKRELKILSRSQRILCAKEPYILMEFKKAFLSAYYGISIKTNRKISRLSRKKANRISQLLIKRTLRKRMKKIKISCN